MSVNNKGFVWLPVLLAILGVLAVSGGAYWYERSKPAAIPQAPAVQQATTAPETQTTPVQTQPQNQSNFTATPSSGSAPLSVWFTGALSDGGKDNQFYRITFGDGSSQDVTWDNLKGAADSWRMSAYHTYPNSGTFTANLERRAQPAQRYGDIVGTATVTVNGPQTISVPGMSQYTDADFGFSFWYPSGWTMTEEPDTNFTTAYPGGVIKKRWVLYSTIDNDHTMTIEEYYSPTASIRLNADSGCPGGICSPTLNYFFDAGAHTWMMAYPNGYKSEGGYSDIAVGTTQAADVSQNTMGGLHIFTGGFRGENTLIPLSAHNFVLVSDQPWNVGSSFKDFLVQTIVATDPSVATPVSTAEQTKTIQAEKDAYASSENITLDYFRVASTDQTSSHLEWSVQYANPESCTILQFADATKSFSSHVPAFPVASSGSLTVAKGFFYELGCSGSHDGQNATISADINLLN